MSPGMLDPAVELAREADFQIGGVSVRPSRRELGDGGAREILEPRVMQVLVALARRRGEVVSRDELIASCWAGRIVGDDAINACVAKARRVGETARAYRIETIPRVGYRLAAAAEALLAEAAPADVLLAVLPFDDLSDDPDLRHFSDGVAEEILHALAHRSDLKVVGRSSSFQFRGPDKATAHVVRELGATHILDGSVRRSGSRIRVSAHLSECRGQTTIWEGRLERELADIFDLQDEIAASVALALRTPLAPAVRSGAVQPEVYDVYLHSRERPDRLTPENLRRRATHLMAMIDRAPAFAETWAALAYTRARLAHFLPTGEALAMRESVRDAAQHALSLDPRCGLAALAMARTFRRREALQEQERWLMRAVEWAPSDALARTELARLRAAVGRGREALVTIREAYRLDPLQLGGIAMLGRTLVENGELAQAIRVLADAFRRWPDFELFPIWLTTAYTMAGELDAARALEPALRTTRFGESVIGYSDLFGPDPGIGEAYMARVRRNFERTPTISLSAVCIGSQLGYAEEVLELALRMPFEVGESQPDPRETSIFNTAQLFMRPQPAVRQSSRFPDLCARFGLVDYWLATDAWPDCADDPGLPYDFRAECRRVAAASPA